MKPVKQISLRGPSDVLVERLRALAEARGQSMNSVILELLERAVGVDTPMERLRRYATWDDHDHAAFAEALAAQRTVEVALWMEP